MHQNVEAEVEVEAGGEAEAEAGAKMPQDLALFLPVMGAVALAQHVLVSLAHEGTAIDHTVQTVGLRRVEAVIQGGAECHAFEAWLSTLSIAVLGRHARRSSDTLGWRSLDAVARNCRDTLDMLQKTLPPTAENKQRLRVTGTRGMLYSEIKGKAFEIVPRSAYGF